MKQLSLVILPFLFTACGDVKDPIVNLGAPVKSAPTTTDTSLTAPVQKSVDASTGTVTTEQTYSAVAPASFQDLKAAIDGTLTITNPDGSVTTITLNAEGTLTKTTTTLPGGSNPGGVFGSPNTDPNAPVGETGRTALYRCENPSKSAIVYLEDYADKHRNLYVQLRLKDGNYEQFKSEEAAYFVTSGGFNLDPGTAGNKSSVIPRGISQPIKDLYKLSAQSQYAQKLIAYQGQLYYSVTVNPEGDALQIPWAICTKVK